MLLIRGIRTRSVYEGGACSRITVANVLENRKHDSKCNISNEHKGLTTRERVLRRCVPGDEGSTTPASEKVCDTSASTGNEACVLAHTLPRRVDNGKHKPQVRHSTDVNDHPDT